MLGNFSANVGCCEASSIVPQIIRDTSINPYHTWNTASNCFMVFRVFLAMKNRIGVGPPHNNNEFWVV